MPQIFRILLTHISLSTENQLVPGLSWKKLETEVPVLPPLEASVHLIVSRRPCSINIKTMA
jgi:hypothetical protein